MENLMSMTVYEQKTGIKWNDAPPEEQLIWITAWNAALEVQYQQLKFLKHEVD